VSAAQRYSTWHINSIDYFYRYLIYSEADFEVIRPAGATRCTDGGEIWLGGGDLPILRAKFHPHRCNDKGVGPQN